MQSCYATSDHHDHQILQTRRSRRGSRPNASILRKNLERVGRKRQYQRQKQARPSVQGRYLGNATKRRRVHVNKSRSLMAASCRGSASAVKTRERLLGLSLVEFGHASGIVMARVWHQQIGWERVQKVGVVVQSPTCTSVGKARKQVLCCSVP